MRLCRRPARVSGKVRWVSGVSDKSADCLVGSGRVVSKFHYTNRTGSDQTCPRLRPGLRQSLVRVKFHYTDPRTWSATRPDQTRPDLRRTKSVHVEIERTSLRPDKVRGLVGDPCGPRVWSGRVLVVEFRNDVTRPDQRQNPVGPV